VFGGYRFEHPKTEATVEVGGWGYLWAGFLGAGYVWQKGCRPPDVLKALAYNISYAIVFFGVGFVTSMPQVPIPTRIWALLLVGMVPTLILMQANTMIRIIRDAYRRRGWMIRLR
jgi:hypothetical protein